MNGFAGPVTAPLLLLTVPAVWLLGRRQFQNRAASAVDVAAPPERSEWGATVRVILILFVLALVVDIVATCILSVPAKSQISTVGEMLDPPGPPQGGAAEKQ